ncbi:ShlB/FhaC/HecB family hemolysin secretion/activation protein [Herbaspirillum sp. RTI4]|uniref:ShlB/FhaC/HecB family hemolysin secretion/activation protein n=1 Tax=Herbaspirillum sp. RTI4 TaxID=3048640 RepID=UPI002AB3EC1C|nr:ShlB/FhaC/HecB family hemolysin secretion/activation protein [Herbaspirillum sp. RTI4]MDY7579779.1 ShlB/FhaC/HecB family hemolysin secretion/activation protein [Herbaspirillum sp. RTI4]MEA9982616.1 ShlB/FhaC/HecB family hemolysin secretion/activation protein [Herbaspirillum sp. RTI4]
MKKQAAARKLSTHAVRHMHYAGMALLLSAAFADARGQSTSIDANEQQRRRSQSEAVERENQSQSPRVELRAPQTTTDELESLALPSESPCFKINSLLLEVPPHLSPALRQAGASQLTFDPFRFAQQYLDQYAGTCIGKEGLNLIVRRLTRLILIQGYSTTRIGIPEQELSSGTLTLALIPGIIRNIRFADPEQRGTWVNAFPTGPGRLLNLRELEQGLEQMKRVPSQDVSMEIVPGAVPGESDVVIAVTRSKPWRLSTTLDDSGAKATGKLQGGLNLSIDNPLGLNDLLNLSLNTDVDRRGGDRGTGGNSLYYGLPLGNWTLALSAGNYRYHQKVAGLYQQFVASGNSRNLDLKIAHLFQRDPSQKNSWQFKVGKRLSSSFINSTEINVQRRNTTYAELAWIHTHYFGPAQLDLTLANRWGTAWLGGQGEADWRTENDPMHRYSLQSLDANLVLPFSVAGQPLTYTGTLRAQTTRSRLYMSDMFAIGNRYTVRGFDGETMLAAERGFFLRNDLEAPIARSKHAVYAGLDVGKVYGPSVRYLLGDSLVGTTVGVRGRIGGMNYDLFSGWSLYKPQGMPNASPAIGFQLSYQY